MNKKIIKKPKREVKMPKEIEDLMSSFRPEFGNEKHIEISEIYSKIIYMKSILIREWEKKEALKKITKSMRESKEKILSMQKYLVGLLKEENKNNGV